MLTKSRIVQLLCMLIVLLSLFFWKTFDDSQDDLLVESGGTSITDTALRCNYETACEFISEQGTYFLSINSLPIRAEEWIDFELSVPLENTSISKAQIAGKTMFMGRIPVKFTKSTDKTFLAKGMVGSCTTSKMIWELQITVENGEHSELLSYDFVIVK